jgi:hypothetical protein
MRGKFLVSEWLYAALLYLYPTEFRTAYDQQMRLTFRDACWAAYQRNGVGGLLALWLPTLLDLLKSALEERARQGEIIMLKERFIELAGPLTIIVGVLMMGGPIGDLVWLVEPSEPVWEFFHFSLPAVSFVLMLPAFLATRLRYQENAGGLGRLGLILSVAGSGGMSSIVLASFLLSALQPVPLRLNWLNLVVAICALSILIGHILFGIDALRYKLFPRWNAMPLLVGLTIPVLSILPTIIASALGLDRYHLDVTIVSLYSAITGVWWMLMGIAMMGQSREPQPAAA